MVALGILFAPWAFWIKAFAISAAFLVQASITMTRTLRDVHENSRFVNRLEGAKAERLLMEIERGKSCANPRIDGGPGPPSGYGRDHAQTR